MSVVIDHQTVQRQLEEIAQVDDDREHDADLGRRKAVRRLSLIGLFGAGARELYRQEYLEALPTARYRWDESSPDWETTLHPQHDSLSGGVVDAAANAVSVVLSSVGGDRRAVDHPWVAIASAGFLAMRAVGSGRQLIGELGDGQVDALTAVDAITTAASVPLALPEAVRAIRALRDRGRDG